MLPPDYPGVIRDGVEALRWAASVYQHAQEHVPELVREARSELEAAVQHHRDEPMVVFLPTEESTRKGFQDEERELSQLARRLDSATGAQWASGSASRLFSVVDLGILQTWEHPTPTPLLLRLGIAPAEVEHQARRFHALREWLERYSKTEG